MSELKAFEVTGKALFGRFYTKKVYDKDEADKVIAAKDAKIRRLRRALLLVCAKRVDAEAHIENNLADLLLKGQTWKSVDFHRLERDKWYKRSVRCRAKAEECK